MQKTPISLKDGDILYLGTWNPMSPGEFVPDHPHGNHYEITIVTRGRGKMYTDNILTKVSEGDIYLSFPFDHHRIESDNDSILRYDFISFTVTNANFSAEFAKVWIDNISAKKRVIRCDEICRLLGELISENNYSDDELSTSLISSIFTNLVITFLRKFATDIKKKSANINLCCDIISYIDANFYSISYLEDISKALGYHYNYMTGIFHKTTGLSLSKYYTTRKLELARTLLTVDGLKISDVAKKLRYSSVQAFSKSFYKHYLFYPREYLRQFPKNNK